MKRPENHIWLGRSVFLPLSVASRSKPVYMIDASSGAVLLHYDNLQKLQGGGPGGNAKTGCYTYGRTMPLPCKSQKTGRACVF